jgi:hypothetical protein
MPDHAAASDAIAAAESPLVVGETASAVVLPKVVPLNDTVMVEVNPSPPIVPAVPPQPDRPVSMSGGAPALARKPVAASRPRRANSTVQRQLIALGALVAALLFAVIGSRASLVRAVPDLAGLYAAVGLPVNLRGLKFTGVHTTHEMQDGIPVLVIEGEVVNVTRQAVEVPRLRFAILGPNRRELYSWTALLPRSMLPEGEVLAFRSRLASPPAEGKQVMVRFLNRLDLTANGR